MQPDARPENPAESLLRVTLEYGLLFLGWLVLLAGPHRITGDGAVRFQALDALLRQGETSPQVPYSLVGPLFSFPLWLAGQASSPSTSWCRSYNFCLFTLGLWLLDRLLRGHVGPPVRRRFLLLLLFASMCTFHVQEYFAEVFTVVLVATGTLAVTTRPAPWGWACIVLGVANTPATAVGFLLMSLYALAVTRRWRWALVVPVGAGLILLESFLRRGHPLATGYENNHGFATLLPYSGLSGFSYPFFFGLVSILFSFGKGLLFFTPGLFLPLPRSANVSADVRFVRRLWLLFTVGLVLVYARWWAWYGGWVWGPRFFLFAAVPASLALAVNLAAAEKLSPTRNLATLLVLALSFWVGAAGQAFNDPALDVCVANDYALEHLAWYVPEFSVLWRPFVVAIPLSVWDVVGLAVSAATFLYLAVPLLGVCMRQLASATQSAWAEWATRPWQF